MWEKRPIDCHNSQTSCTWSPRTGCSLTPTADASANEYLAFGGASHEQGPTDEAWLLSVQSSEEYSKESKIAENPPLAMTHVPRDPESWPPARYDHAAVAVRVLDGTDFVKEDNQEKTHEEEDKREVRWKRAVLILGGAGADGRLLDDLWFFDTGMLSFYFILL